MRLFTNLISILVVYSFNKTFDLLTFFHKLGEN